MQLMKAKAMRVEREAEAERKQNFLAVLRHEHADSAKVALRKEEPTLTKVIKWTTVAELVVMTGAGAFLMIVSPVLGIGIVAIALGALMAYTKDNFDNDPHVNGGHAKLVNRHAKRAVFSFKLFKWKLSIFRRALLWILDFILCGKYQPLYSFAIKQV